MQTFRYKETLLAGDCRPTAMIFRLIMSVGWLPYGRSRKAIHSQSPLWHLEQKNASQTGLGRRKFPGPPATAVAAFSIVPRHVLGGAKFVAPSEKINIAIIGCGGQ